MALIVEDGTGKADAQSYVSIAEVRAYFAARGGLVITNTVPNDAGLEVATLLAAQYMDNQYRQQWKGRKTTLVQSMQWPRVGATIDETDDYDGPAWGAIAGGFPIQPTQIPQNLKDAQCELALRQVQYSELAPDLKPGAGALISERIDTLARTWAQGATPFRIYRVVEMLVRPLITAGAGQVRLVRG